MTTDENDATVLSGQHVVLRPLAVDDAEITLLWRLGARARLLNAGAQTVEEQARWIASRPETERNFIIETKAGVPVGMIALVDISVQHRRAEAARFLIGDEAAVRGIPVAVEAMKLLYELAFDRLGLQRVYGVTAAENTLMIKWHKYLGMAEEGRLRRHTVIDGQLRDIVCLGLLVEEYRTITLPRLNALVAAVRPPGS